jgi:hypothetical protein
MYDTNELFVVKGFKTKIECQAKWWIVYLGSLVWMLIFSTFE